jgi:hypothetical protein
MKCAPSKSANNETAKPYLTPATVSSAASSRAPPFGLSVCPAGCYLSDGRRVIFAAEDKAREIGQPINIAVVDGGANLVNHVRMDGAWIGSIDISITKAFTARTRHRDDAAGGK